MRNRLIDSKRFHRLLKEGFWVILGQLIAIGGSMAGVRLLTELLEPDAYGELALGMTLAALVNQTILGPIGNGVTRFYAPAAERGDLRGYFGAALRLVLCATGIIVLIMIITVAGLMIGGRKEWIGIATAALIFAIFSGYNSILNGIQNAARQRSIVALHQGVESWVRFLIAAGLLLALGATSTVAMLGYSIAVLLVLGSQYLFVRKISSKPVTEADQDGDWQSDIWKFSWPISIFGIFTWVQLASDRWALNFFATTQDVGLYSALFQLGYYPMSMASGMATTFLTPIFYERAGDGGDNRRNASVSSLGWRLSGFVLGMTGVALLATLLFHRQMFQIFVAKEYLSVSFLLPWMLFAGGVFAAGQTLALNLLSQMKTQAMLPAKIVTAVFGVGLNFVGAYFYGIVGIVIAGVLFSILYCVWMLALLMKKKEE